MLTVRNFKNYRSTQMTKKDPLWTEVTETSLCFNKNHSRIKAKTKNPEILREQKTHRVLSISKKNRIATLFSRKVTFPLIRSQFTTLWAVKVFLFGVIAGRFVQTNKNLSMTLGTTGTHYFQRNAWRFLSSQIKKHLQRSHWPLLLAYGFAPHTDKAAGLTIPFTAIRAGWLKERRVCVDLSPTP